MRPFRALLLDLDGTLVDSRAATEGAWRDWAQRHGLPGDEVARTCHGVPSRQHVEAWAPHLDAAAESAAVEAAQVASREPTPALRGAFEVLRVLPPARIAIVTSGTPELAHARLRWSGLPQPGVMVCAGDTERGKPDPDPYALGAELVGVPAAECLVLEDAPAGVEAARAAGCEVEVVGPRGRDLRELVPELRAARLLPERDAAVALVEAAFTEAPRPEDDDLLRRDALDDVDVAVFRGFADWRAVPAEIVTDHWAALGSLSPEGLAAFAAPFMLWSLRHPDHPSFAAEALERELADPGRLAAFTPAQRDAAAAWRVVMSPWSS